MARISSYIKDGTITIDDKLIGSSYEGEGISGAIFETKNFKIRDLLSFFSRNLEQGGEVYNLGNLFSNFGTFDENGNLTSMSEAFANLVLSVTTSEKYANAQFVTNLATSVGVFNPDGTLSSLSEAFANQVLSTTSSERFATSLFATNLASSVGAYDENGVITSLSEAFANQVISTTTSDKFATSEFATNLATSFGTYNADGSIATFSESFADQVLSTANTSEFAQAQFVTNLASSLGTTDAEGNLTVSEAFANQVLNTETTTDYAQAEFVTNLASSLGTTDAEGNLTVSEAFANQVLNTETTTDYAQAQFVTNLASSLGTTDADGNLTVSETFANQVLNTETTTDYAEASFVTNLASSLGTTDAQGNLTVSEAFANSVLETETTSDFASALSVTQLTTTVGNIPLIFRQDDPPSLTETPIGSLWFETDNNNKGYILVAGDPNVWTIVEDTEFTQFKSTYEEIINNTATESSATATKTTRLNAVLEILDENGNLIPQSQSEYFDTITNYVDANSATAEKAEELRVAIEGDGTDPGISATLTETSEAVASKPNVYRQTTEPVAPEGETIPIKSVWYDTGDNNKPYVYDGSPAAWVEARDGKVTELESYARAQKTIEADANGVVTGITVKSENSGDPDTAISDITFKTNTFNIVDQSDNVKLAFDQTGLTINGSGTFTGDITGASGTFGGTVSGATVVGGVISVPTNDSNRKFYVDSQGSVYISDQAAGTPGLNVRDDSNGSTGVTIASDRIYTAPGVELFLTPYASGIASGYIKWGDTATISTGVSNKLYITTATARFSGDVEIVGDLIVTGESSSHPNITGASNVDNIGQTVIQSLDFDDFGHVIGTGSVSIAYPAIINNGGSPELPTGITGDEIRSLIGAGTGSSDFSGSYNDLSDKPTIYGEPGIYRSGGAPTLASGVTGAEIRSLIGAGTSSFDGAYASLTGKPTLGTASAEDVGYFATAGHLHDTRYLKLAGGQTVNGTITATDFILSSDQRLKSDINTYVPQPINIKYRDYLINNGGDRRRVGVIAQELEKDHPEFVMTNPDTGMKAVSYIDMLVAKVAELEERIKQLENGGA
jgi:hypothetical protein